MQCVVVTLIVLHCGCSTVVQRSTVTDVTDKHIVLSAADLGVIHMFSYIAYPLLTF